MTSGSRWSVYIVRCSDGSFYTGIATDVARRLAEHETGPKGSKYVRGRGPFRIAFQREVGDRGLATRLELRIKRLGRDEKKRLIRAPERLDTILAELQQTVDQPPLDASG